MGLTTPLTAPIQALAGYGASYAWPGFLSLSRATILSLLQRINLGQLKITDVDGTVTVCGQEKIKPVAQQDRTIHSIPATELKVNKDVFWVRLLLFADMVGSTNIGPPRNANKSRASQKATC